MTVYCSHPNDLDDTILKKVWKSCKEKQDHLHNEALWQATALLISNKELNRNLLHCIAWSQVGILYDMHEYGFIFASEI